MIISIKHIFLFSCHITSEYHIFLGSLYSEFVCLACPTGSCHTKKLLQLRTHFPLTGSSFYPSTCPFRFITSKCNNFPFAYTLLSCTGEKLIRTLYSFFSFFLFFYKYDHKFIVMEYTTNISWLYNNSHKKRLTMKIWKKTEWDPV